MRKQGSDRTEQQLPELPELPELPVFQQARSVCMLPYLSQVHVKLRDFTICHVKEDGRFHKER